MKKIIIATLLVLSFLITIVSGASCESTTMNFEETMRYLNRVSYSRCGVTSWGFFGRVSYEGEDTYFDLYLPQFQKAWFIEVKEENGQYVAELEDIERIIAHVAEEVIGDDARE